MDVVFLKDWSVSFSGDDFKGSRKIEVDNKKQLYEAVNRWRSADDKEDVLLYGYDKEKMKHDFRQSFYYLEAAGGVVFNTHNQVLFIYRSGLWDLPKGKVDEGEGIEECALREVEEETGVEGLSIIEPLKASYHIYFSRQKWHLKKTYWFYMETSYAEALKPQVEEEITEARWMNQKECREALRVTFRSIRESIGREVWSHFDKIK